MNDIEKSIYSLSIRVSDDSMAWKQVSSGNVCKYNIFAFGGGLAVYFIDQNGEVYIAPNDSKVISMLKQLGYKREDDTISYPWELKSMDGKIDEKCKELINKYAKSFIWKQLDDSVLKSYARKRFSAKGITDLPNFIKGLSIKVTKDVTCTVINSLGEKITSPLDLGRDFIVRRNIVGTMHMLESGDLVMYVDQNGDCYLIHTIFSEILKEAGYQEIYISSDWSFGVDNLVVNFENKDSEAYSQYKTQLELVELLKDRRINPNFIIEMGERLYKEKFSQSHKTNNNIGVKK